jgi:prephenate dehydrogenase
VKPPEQCTTGIAGLGLMGGALAMALRRMGARRLLACDISGETLDAAKQSGLIDEGWPIGEGGASPDTMLAQCDLVFLCLNPSTLIRFMEQWMGAFKSGAIITDIAGVKSGVVEYAEKNLRPDLDFIPGHPMAGAEKGGFANAGLCNFYQKNYILTPLKRNRPENLEFIRALIYRLGFGRITETTAAEHDRNIAFTSQLCHVIAAALIDCETDPEITRFGGGSFEDLTRIAMLNAPMWTELFLENRAELLRRIDLFEGSLDALKVLIAGKQEKRLEEKLALVRDRRTLMAEREKEKEFES